MADIIKEKWTDILDFMKSEFEMTEVSFNTFLLPMKPLKRDGSNYVIIATKNPAIIGIVKKKFENLLPVAIHSITGEEVTPVFILEEEAENFSSGQKAEPAVDPYLEAVRNSNLNPKYTFDSFVSGKSNELAHAAALAVAENPGSDYKILYIYGGVGLGKTHLMQAIGHYILKKEPKQKILYVSSETFINDYIESMVKNKNGDMNPGKFREKYRKEPDVLLIDDIQFIAGKEGTQEEFFHTFNELYDHNKQIVITSDKSPKEINNLEDRIRSRFEGGLVVDIQAPDFETRMAILRKKEEIEGFNIDDEVIKYIADNIKSNIRTLEGALQKLILKSKLTKTPINVDMAKENLKDMIGGTSEKEAVTPQKIISIVAEHFGITEKDLISTRRNSEIAFPRQIAMYLCCEKTEAVQQSIGDALGGRDHSTIVYGRDKIADELKENQQLRVTIDALNKKIDNLCG